MQEQDIEVSCKVIIVGDGCVGKTSLITRYAKGSKTADYKKTIGTDFFEKEITLKATGDTVKMMLWDTAGQEMFADLTKSYYRGAGCVIYVFTCVDRHSFTEIERWREKVRAECGDNIVSVLVQNKMDLIDQAVMTPTEVDDLARRVGMRLYRTCVKDNVLVNDVFEYVAEQFIKSGGKSELLDIDDLKANAAANKENTNTNGGSSGGGSNGSNGSKDANVDKLKDLDKPEQTKAAEPNKDSQKAFTLGTVEPSTRRTKGKKNTPCVIL